MGVMTMSWADWPAGIMCCLLCVVFVLMFGLKPPRPKGPKS